MNKVLIIEDDADIAQIVEHELKIAGYKVIHCNSGVNGLTALREHKPNLVILDLGLPDMEGGEVATRIRKTSDVPIIVLTAVDQIDRKVGLLNSGANDYLTKPFHPGELLARISVQLRSGNSHSITLGSLELNLEKRICRYGDQEVYLSPREFNILAFLARQPGRVYSRDEIGEGIWGAELPSNSNIVDVHMANIRSKLREVNGYGVIRTVRGIGYAIKSK